MKGKFYLSLVILCISIFGTTVYGAPKEKVNLNKITNAFGKRDQIQEKQYEKTNEWTWMEFDCLDEQYPITIDILFNTKIDPDRTVYLIAPSGYNFRTNYFTPLSHNIAEYMRKNNYLVVGITYREDHVPSDHVGKFMLQWGLDKHRLDMRKIISTIQNEINLPYELLGQSSSAVCILDYAAHYSEPAFEKIILLDTDSFDPNISYQKTRYAQLTYEALNQLIKQGVYADPFAKNLKQLILAAMSYPNADSGQARPYGLPGNFTYNGLLYYSLMYTALLPGIHTSITGLPGEWVMVNGVSAGSYVFRQDPLADGFTLFLTDAQILPLIADQMGEGISPLALERDIYAILASNGTYTIDWSGIQEKVVMINGRLSCGNQVYYGTQIRNAGNSNVTIYVIPGHGYTDLLYGADAEQNVWVHFLE